LIDVTTSVASLELGSTPPSSIHPAKALAETIRVEVKKSTGCEGELSYSLFLVQKKKHLPCSQYRHLPQHPPRPISHPSCETRKLVPSRTGRCSRIPRALGHCKFAWFWSFY
jgi:hypothetical protein